VYDVALTLAAAGEEVLIVGHSFGGLVAVDAVAAGLAREVSLVTLGSLLQFLKVTRPELQAGVDNCVSSSSLIKWDDYGSYEDWFGRSALVTGGANTYIFHLVEFGIPFYKRFSLAAHRAYYRDSAVLCAMLLRPSDGQAA
jgi:pimeloyl-ACP methyl ester carboxylesterase